MKSSSRLVSWTAGTALWLVLAPLACDDGEVDGGDADASVTDDATTNDASNVPDAREDAASHADANANPDANVEPDANVDPDAGVADDAGDLDAAAEDDAGDAAVADDAGDAAVEPVDPSDEIFAADRFPHFELELDAAAIADLSSTSNDPKLWVKGRFRYGDEVFEDVSVRRKGSSTYRALPKKASLKIRFNKGAAHKERRFHGLTDLTLNNGVSDGSFLAERLAYYTHAALGLPASRANSARLSINGQNYGVYVNVETANENLIQRIYGQGEGERTLYELATGDWSVGTRALFDEEVGDGSLADVDTLLATVDAARPAHLLEDTATVLDIDKWLGHCAAEAITGHHDGYAYGKWGSHNYHMSAGPDGRFSLLPWSTDLTHTNNNGTPNANTPGTANVPDNGRKTLLQKCKADATANGCWARYKTVVSASLATVAGLNLEALAHTWHDQIDAAVRADPKKELSNGGYDGETNKLYAWILARPALVRTQLGLP